MKRYLLLLLLICLAFTGNAQVRIGTFGGFTSSSFNTKGFYADMKGKMSPNFGVLCEFNITEQFFLSSRALYKQIKADGVSNSEMDNISLELSFIEIPVTIKYEFGEYLKPYFIMGANLQYYLSSDFEFRKEGEYYKGELNKRVNDIDLSMLIGGGLNIDLGNAIVFLEANYSIGINNKLNEGTFTIRKDSETYQEVIDPEYSMKIKDFNFVIGTMLPIN